MERYRFLFTSRRLLCRALVIKIQKELKSKPRQMEVPQAHELKLMSSTTKLVSTQVDVEDSKPLTATAIQLDPVWGHNALRERIH